MPRSLISLLATVAFTLSGCAMCQDCQDELGASPESENYTTYSQGDRAGSAFTGGGSPAGYEEEYVDMSVEQSPTLAAPQTATQGSSRR